MHQISRKTFRKVINELKKHCNFINNNKTRQEKNKNQKNICYAFLNSIKAFGDGSSNTIIVVLSAKKVQALVKIIGIGLLM